MRVAILMSDTGGGDRRLSQALATALADLTGAEGRGGLVEGRGKSLGETSEGEPRLEEPGKGAAPRG